MTHYSSKLQVTLTWAISGLRNGLSHFHQRKRRKSSKMSHNSFSHGERGCATSWSTKVRKSIRPCREGTIEADDWALSCSWHLDTKVVYRRYASLFFIAGCDATDNELITLEIVHRYVEQMDKYYGNVCELDIIFNFQKAYFILDELLLAGEMQESSKKNVLRCIGQQDSLEDIEVSTLNFCLISCLWNITFPWFSFSCILYCFQS